MRVRAEASGALPIDGLLAGPLRRRSVRFHPGPQELERGSPFVALRSTTSDEGTSCIRPPLTRGAEATTRVNPVDGNVTEHGMAELRGCSIRAVSDTMYDRSRRGTVDLRPPQSYVRCCAAVAED